MHLHVDWGERNKAHDARISNVKYSINLDSSNGCHSDHSESVDLCQPHEGLTPICGFQSPEDLALLPDKSGLLVSEFGQMGDEDGRLSMLSVSDSERTVLYASDMPCDSTAPLTDRFEVVLD